MENEHNVPRVVSSEERVKIRDLIGLLQKQQNYIDILMASLGDPPRRKDHGEWISVKDRLPEVEEWVLAWSQDEHFNVSQRYRIKMTNIDCVVWQDSSNIYRGELDPTHWMPLPPPPK